MGKQRSEKKQILVYCDGETEKLYLKDLKKYDHIPFSMRPNLKLATLKALEKIKDMAEIDKSTSKLTIEEHSQVYCIVDLDQIHNQSLYTDYQNLVNEVQKIDNATVIELYPCFETWIKFHYEIVNKPISNCKAMEMEVKKNIPNYIKARCPAKLYEYLKPNLNTAISNSKQSIKNRSRAISLGTRIQNCKVPFSEFHILLESIGLNR